jgi:hypothetical protein
VRSYCRGVVVRAVNTNTRQRLFERLDVTEMAGMRSFLDAPKRPGITVKGSGEVRYHLHSRNCYSKVVQQDSHLHHQVRLSCFLFCIVLCIHVSAIRTLQYRTLLCLPLYMQPYLYVCVSSRITYTHLVDRVHPSTPGP